VHISLSLSAVSTGCGGSGRSSRGVVVRGVVWLFEWWCGASSTKVHTLLHYPYRCVSTLANLGNNKIRSCRKWGRLSAKSVGNGD
jgi:hypothetical protein